MTSPKETGLVVVTGAGGFVGTNLVPYLQSMGYRVARVSLREPGWDIPAGARAVVHLAGLAHDVRNARNPEEYSAVNTDLTRAVFSASLGSGAEKFIFVSSVKAVADSPGSEPLAEDAEPRPGTPYGRSKREAERAVLGAAEGRAGVYVLRPCMMHGPGNKGNLNLLYRWVSRGIPYPFAAFENRRSFLSVENFDWVVGELCRRDDVPSGVYHVADSESLSTSEVVDAIQSSSGRPRRQWRVPEGWVRAFARLGDVLRLPVNSGALEKLTGNYRVSNAKLLRALGDRGLPLSAREGLRRTLEGFGRF